MCQLLLEDISFQINKVQIATNKSFKAEGLCSLAVSSDSGILKSVLLLFSKTHMYSSNDIQIQGNVFVDGQILPASKIHFLLNQNLIFNGNDNVLEGLVSVNSEEALRLIGSLEIGFSKKKICKLNADESKIFEVAVNLAASPKIIFIGNIEIEEKLKNNCLNHLRKYVNDKKGVVIVETEFSDLFDSAIVIKREEIVTLDGIEADIYFNRKRNSLFDVPETNHQVANHQVDLHHPIDYMSTIEQLMDYHSIDGMNHSIDGMNQSSHCVDAMNHSIDQSNFDGTNQSNFDGTNQSNFDGMNQSNFDAIDSHSHNLSKPINLSNSSFIDFQGAVVQPIEIRRDIYKHRRKGSFQSSVRAQDFEEFSGSSSNESINSSFSSEIIHSHQIKAFKKLDVPFLYKNFFRKYGTQEIIDLKHKNIPVLERLFNLNFYKIKILESLRLGLRRYEKAFQRQEQILAVCKSISPCILSIFILRFLQILNDRSLLKQIPHLISLLIFTFFNQKQFPFLAFFFIQTFLIKNFSFFRIFDLLRHFFRSEIGANGYFVIIATVCFSIIYNYSSIFEEEAQFHNHNMNILINPGTYVLSIFVYMFLTHFTFYVTLGLLLNVKLMPHASMSASFTNLLCLSCSGERLRASLTGISIAILLIKSLANLVKIKLKLLNASYILVFPCLSPCFSFDNDLRWKHFFYYWPPYYFYLYCIFTYVICCFSLSFR